MNEGDEQQESGDTGQMGGTDDTSDAGDYEFPEGAILIMVDGVVREATEDESAEIIARWNALPPDPVKVPSVPPTAFAKLLASIVGVERAAAIIQMPVMFLAYAGASKIDYDDVFVAVDGTPPPYAAMLVAAEIVAQEEVDALEAAWPTS